MSTERITRSNVLQYPDPNILVSGYLMLAQKLYEEGDVFAEAFNFSPEGEPAATVKDIIDALIRKMGRGSYSIDETKRNLHEASFLRLDSGKAAACLHWLRCCRRKTA
ncbi:MAG: hypothetical protein P4M13_00750 [Alphaproteobacteria bacterium]|nr:hypothetical protein [Alphaproteobacteria bacterium]